VTIDWSRVIEVKNELTVSRLSLTLLLQTALAVRGELGGLPRLSLISSEILYGEWLEAEHGKETFSTSVDSKPAQVTPDPTSPELLGNHCCRTATNEAIK